MVAPEHDDVLAHRDQVLFLVARHRVLDDQLAPPAGRAGELHHAVDLGDLGGILGPAGFEQLGHAGQTARDVLGADHLAGRLGQHGAGHHLRGPCVTITCAPAGIE
jgi:hypothetical protein